MFDQLPSLVMRKLADYLDTATWLIASKIYPRWRLFPPRTLTLSGAPDLASTTDRQLEEELIRLFPSSGRISHIRGDPIYGGPTEHGNSICLSLTRLISRKPTLFQHVSSIDMTGQTATVMQLAKLFSPRNTKRLAALERMALAIDFVREVPGNENDVATPPPNLHTLAVYCTGSATQRSQLPLLPLLRQVRHLTWLTKDATNAELCHNPQLLSLETSMRFLPGHIGELMPNLQTLICRTDEHATRCCHLGQVGCRVYDRTGAGLARVRRFVTFPQADIDMVEDLHGVVSSLRQESFESYRNLRTFHLLCNNDTKSLEEVVHVLEQCVLPALGRYRLLEEVTLPPEILIAWSTLKDVRPTLVAMGSGFRFLGVHRLNFGSMRDSGYHLGENIVYADVIACDDLLPSFLQMFPNLEVLRIYPVPFFSGVSCLDGLEKILPRLRKLCVHTASIPYDWPRRHTAATPQWLPHCRSLDVFVYHATTRRRDWSEERRTGGLLDNLARNRSLRFALIVVGNRPGVGPLPSRSDIAYVAQSWADRPWRCVAFLQAGRDSHENVTAAVQKPTTGARSGARQFSIVTLTFQSFKWKHPELYSILWKEVCNAIDVEPIS